LELYTFLSAIVGSGIGAGIVGVLFKAWVEHRLTIDRDRLSELRQIEHNRREASADALVSILSDWVRPTYMATGFPNEERWRLQTAYWRMVLTLDKRLLEILLPRLANDPTAVSINEIIVQVRAKLLDLPKPDVRAEELNTWRPSNLPASS
jgi:hypothetical protein